MSSAVKYNDKIKCNNRDGEGRQDLNEYEIHRLHISAYKVKRGRCKGLMHIGSFVSPTPVRASRRSIATRHCGVCLSLAW